MNSLDTYIADTQACRTEDELFAAFDHFVRKLGVEFWAYHILSEKLQAVPFESGAIRQNFPASYVAHYNQNNLAAVDPIVVLCRREAKPFHWLDVETRMQLTPAQAEFIAGVRESVITDGLAIPLFGPMNSLAYFSLATTRSERLDLSEADLRELQFICLQTHNRYLDIIGDGTRELARKLSPRELEVLTFVASGLSNAQIAKRLGITDNTVDTLLRRIFAKLNVSNRITAVLKAIGSGLILAQPNGALEP